MMTFIDLVGDIAANLKKKSCLLFYGSKQSWSGWKSLTDTFMASVKDTTWRKADLFKGERVVP